MIREDRNLSICTKKHQFKFEMTDNLSMWDQKNSKIFESSWLIVKLILRVGTDACKWDDVKLRKRLTLLNRLTWRELTPLPLHFEGSLRQIPHLPDGMKVIDFSSIPDLRLSLWRSSSENQNNNPFLVVERVILSSCWSGELRQIVVPSLKKLELGQWDGPLDRFTFSRADSLVNLSLGHQFDQPLDFLDSSGQWRSYLPATLNQMTLRSEFSHPIRALPEALLHLMMDSSIFNHPIHCLPNTLETLRLGSRYNHPVTTFLFPLTQETWLPPHLKCLRFGSEFDQPLGTIWDDDQTHFSFDPRSHLPEYLVELVVGNRQFSFPLHHLPPSLSRFVILSSSHSFSFTIWPSLKLCNT